MEVKKFSSFVVKVKEKGASPLVPQSLAKTIIKPKPKHQPLPKPEPKTKLEAKGLSLENKKKVDIIYAKCFVKTSRKEVDYNYQITSTILLPSLFTLITFLVNTIA